MLLSCVLSRVVYANNVPPHVPRGTWGGEGREGVETPIHRAGPSVMRASRGVRRSNCKQIWLRVHDPSEGMLKLLLYKILLV